MKKKLLKKRESILFIITSVLLILFQTGTYIKLCRMPNPFSLNLILLYIALIWPLIIKRINDKRLEIIFFIIYLIYFAIVFGGFLESMYNPNVNCAGTIFIDASELTQII